MRNSRKRRAVPFEQVILRGEYCAIYVFAKLKVLTTKIYRWDNLLAWGIVNNLFSGYKMFPGLIPLEFVFVFLLFSSFNNFL